MTSKYKLLGILVLLICIITLFLKNCVHYLVYDLSLAYVGGFIFYFVASFETNYELRERNIAVNKVSIALLIAAMEEVIIFSLHIIRKDTIIEKTSEINEKIIEIDKDIIHVTIDEEIDNSKVWVGNSEQNQQYFKELNKLCRRVQERNEAVLKNSSILPIDIIDVLIKIQYEKLQKFVKHSLGINEYFINKHNHKSSFTNGDYRKFNEYLIELISSYKKLKNLTNKNLKIKWEEREVSAITLIIGLAFDKFTNLK